MTIRRILFGSIILIASLKAEVIVNTIIPGGQSMLADSRDWAIPFKPAAAYALTSIALPLAATEAPAAITVSLLEDANGQPGEPIETFQINVSGKSTVYTIPSLRHPQLNKNTQYWIVVSPGNSSNMSWSTGRGASNIAYPQAFREHGGNWSLVWIPGQLGIAISGEPINPSTTRI
jgi:hypothetical protein